MFKKWAVRLYNGAVIHIWTDMQVSIGDVVITETRKGLVRANVVELVGEIEDDPFESGRATCHVVENVTQKITKEEVIMIAGQKTGKEEDTWENLN